MAKIINATQARSKINEFIDETAQNHEPIIITGKRNNVVMVSQEDWNAIQDILGKIPANSTWESITKYLL